MNGLKSRILFLVFVIFTISLVETIQIADAATIIVPTDFSTIQDAINAASEGDTIDILDGTYTQTSSLNLNKDNISIVGESESNTIIDVTGISASNQNAIIWNNNDVTLKTITLQGPSTHFGIKISGANNPILENVTVKDSKKTGVDLNGVNGGSITDVTVTGTTNGFGINMVDSNNLTLTDITTSGNAWGGVSIQTFGKFHPGGSDNIKFTGTFNAQEDPGFFLEQDPCKTPSSFCSGGEIYDITNIQPPTKFEYITFGLRTADDYKQTFYKETLTGAKSLGDALAVFGSFSNMIIHDIPTPGANQISVENIDKNNLYVIPGLEIQDAVDAALDNNKINVDAGLYEIDSTIAIDKPLTLLGPKANIDPRTDAALRTAGDASEAIIDGGNTVGELIQVDADNVTINGFEIKSGTGDLIKSEGDVILNPVIRYNTIHASSDDEGIQLKDVDNALVEFNHILDTAGDGINIARSHDSMIQSNEVHDIDSPDAAIYVYNDGERERIDITIQNNLVYDVHQNDGIKLGDKGGSDEALSGGNILNNIVHDTRQDGITIYASDTLVSGNEVYNSASENGAVYVSWNTDNITIRNNNIHDNEKSLDDGPPPFDDPAMTYGIRIGKVTFPTNVTVNGNIIRNNEAGLFYNFQTGNPLLDATNNYWGHVKGPIHSGNSQGNGDTITDNVSFDPWYINSVLGVLSNEVGTEPSNDKKITSKSDKVKLDDGDDTIKIKGQAALPEDIVEIELNNDSVLDVNYNIEEKVDDDIDIGGTTIDLKIFDIQLDDDNTTIYKVVTDLTVPKKVANVKVVVEKAVKLESGTIAEPIIITNSDLPTVIVSIPDETTILAPAGWTGTIQPPKAASNSGTAPSGFTVGDTVIEVGSPDAVLLFDTPVTLTLEGVTGSVGYKPSGSTVWTQITESCGGSFDNPDAPSFFPGECFISDGSDTKIVTYHFTSFGGLGSAPSAPTESSSAKSSGGGSGRTNVSPEEIAKKSSTSLSRVGDWVSSKDYFKIGLRDLISKGHIENVVKIPTGTAPDWFYSVGKEWDAGNITNQEYFDAVKYLIDYKILK